MIKTSGNHFVGFKTETCGVWAIEAKKWTSQLGKAWILQTDNSRASSFLKQQIALAPPGYPAKQCGKCGGSSAPGARFT